MISVVSRDGTFVGGSPPEKGDRLHKFVPVLVPRVSFALHVTLYQRNGTVWKAVIADKDKEQIPDELTLNNVLDVRDCIIRMEAFVLVRPHFTPLLPLDSSPSRL